MTTDDRYPRLRALFDRAADLPAVDRTALLERECADDPELRAHLEKLLSIDGEGLRTGTPGALPHARAPAESPAVEDRQGATSSRETFSTVHRSSTPRDPA